MQAREFAFVLERVSQSWSFVSARTRPKVKSIHGPVAQMDRAAVS
jgi:hypothetical protein